MKQTSPDMKHIILAKMNVKLYIVDPLRFASAAKDLRGGGSFNFTFLHRFFLKSAAKKLQKLVHCCQSYHKKVAYLF